MTKKREYVEQVLDRYERAVKETKDVDNLTADDRVKVHDHYHNMRDALRTALRKVRKRKLAKMGEANGR